MRAMMEGITQGTLGRRGGHKHSLGSGGLTGSGGGLTGSSAALRRQRSLEWRNDRGYSSSEDEIPTRGVGGQVDSHVFASLLAQAQQFSSKSQSNSSNFQTIPKNVYFRKKYATHKPDLTQNLSKTTHQS